MEHIDGHLTNLKHILIDKLPDDFEVMFLDHLLAVDFDYLANGEVKGLVHVEQDVEEVTGMG